jgi:isoquinoline 1-oxidoreductase beta subunit
MVGSGLSLGLFGREVRAANSPGPLVANAFVTVNPDGRVTIVCHRTEMGQGIRSSIPMLIADELGADLDQVVIAQAVGDPRYGDQNTDGSRSIRTDWDRLRRLGAVARTMLVTAAAKRWGVPATACHALAGRVVHEASGRSFGFGELVADAAALPIPSMRSVVLRPLSELAHVGVAASKKRPLADGLDIVTGRGVFGADVRLDGMWTAVIVRPPVVLGRVKRFSDEATLKVPGVVQTIELPALTAPVAFKPLGGVAVLATNTWAAMKGAAALEVEWEHGPHADYDSEPFRDELLEAVRRPGKVVRELGDVDRALGIASRRLISEYHLPHLAHAPMEPPVAVANVSDGRCEVWTSTQNPQAARALVARVLGMSESQVTVHVTLTGGGFGRKSKPDFAAEAALLSRAAGRPVRVQWTRKDDLAHGYLHTVSAQRFEAGLDPAGNVTAWLQRTAFPPIPSTFVAGLDEPSDGELNQGVLDTPLQVPNLRMEAGRAKAKVRIGWLRSVCNIFHAYGLGTFIDELAELRGVDPKAQWLELLGPPRKPTPNELGAKVGLSNYGLSLDEHPLDTGRLRDVIERVTKMSAWDSRPKLARDGSGRALGLAAHASFNAFVACVVAVVMKEGGRPHIEEAWVSVDAGQVVNADRVRAQMEGAVIFGMSVALHGNITAKHGVIEQRSFRDYPIVRMAEAPRAIHVDIVPSTATPAGVGEPGVPPVAPAIANAIAALTFERHRSLPIIRR